MEGSPGRSNDGSRGNGPPRMPIIPPMLTPRFLNRYQSTLEAALAIVNDTARIPEIDRGEDGQNDDGQNGNGDDSRNNGANQADPSPQ